MKTRLVNALESGADALERIANTLEWFEDIERQRHGYNKRERI